MTISHSERLLADLSAKGYRASKIRSAVVEILSAHHEPITAPELLMALAKKKITANKTTIYRELAALKHERIVQEVQFGENKKRYELMPEDHHHHLICIECDRVEDVGLANDLNAIEKKISREYRFKILNHALEFYGLCKNCQRRSA
jgi:Fe2+ or Zn2+ uptake regulation protein